MKTNSIERHCARRRVNRRRKKSTWKNQMIVIVTIIIEIELMLMWSISIFRESSNIGWIGLFMSKKKDIHLIRCCLFMIDIRCRWWWWLHCSLSLSLVPLSISKKEQFGKYNDHITTRLEKEEESEEEKSHFVLVRRTS